MYKHIVSISGGKDSQATLHLAIERGIDFIAVFADTGHEHEETYKHIEYLHEQVHPIKTVRAPAEYLAQRIENKRQFIINDQRAEGGWTDEAKERALAVLHPTGNAFLDLCLWKGRFPSTRRRFCSEILKHEPIREQVVEPLQADGFVVISWQGVRADESRSRANLAMVDEPEEQLIVYRPIITWTAQDVFAYIKATGHRYNPLYEKGMGRVGCMPCIHARKDELRQIAQRFPEVIDRIDEWETLVSAAAKRETGSTFFVSRGLEKDREKLKTVHHTTHGIRQAVEWSKTSRGGRQFNMFAEMEERELEMCSSIYGLCESAE